MVRLILARHGESTASARGLLNGDASADVVLTERGVEEARALGRDLAAVPLDLAVHTAFPRTRETLELALGSRDVPVIDEPRLGDPRAGDYEGKTLDEYRKWAWTAGSRVDAPGGGERRLAVVDRYVAAYRDLLVRPEETVLAVIHALPIAYLVLALDGQAPRPRVDVQIEYARPYRFSADELARSLAVLEGWCASPTW